MVDDVTNKREGTFITCLNFYISNWFTQCRPILMAGNLEGFHDKNSPFHKLSAPNNVVKDVMPIVWEYLTFDWQVSKYFFCVPNIQAFGIKRELVWNIGWSISGNLSVDTL